MTAWHLVAVALVLLCGCPKPPPPPAPFIPQDMQSCAAGVAAVFDTGCDGYFAADNTHCAVCKGGGGCYDARDGVYCIAAADCVNETHCRYVGDFEAGRASRASFR